MKTVTIMGSTGSIGRQTLEVIEAYPDRLTVRGLAAHRSSQELIAQAKAFRPREVAIGDPSRYREVHDALTPLGIEVLSGESGLETVAADSGAEVVVAAIAGFAGLRSTLAACQPGVRLALANKESVVCAGELLMDRARQNKVEIIPVDSEHSALYQCLIGESPEHIQALILTASGGPFRDRSLDEMADMTPSEALAHPRWDMGPKISIDSATLMNKGLEVLEARWLFNLPLSRVEVVVHPESIVHSLVRFADGTLKAHLGATDMRYPILYAFSHPERWEDPGFTPFQLPGVSLHFESPDEQRFPCLALARRAGQDGGLAPTALVAADDVAVEAFLNHRLGFLDIARVIEAVLDAQATRPQASLVSMEAIYAEAQWARDEAETVIKWIQSGK